MSRRAAFLDQCCADEPQLRAEVDSLLEHAGQTISDAFGAAAAEVLLSDRPVVGQRAGVYRIVAEIGRGGMGAVYKAVRDDGEFQQVVALKLVKRGMDTDAALERFRQERQILARLDHPNIARLHDGGSFSGQPYFVMELVEGEPIDAYCRRCNLTTEQRCRLFLGICGGVAYAHRNLVVHRDLKPSNILVSADGTPKLLDFGVAKVLDSGVPEMTVTRAEQRMFTPEYASPEQIRGQPVTVATDVYALCAILYELLTGVRAHLTPEAPIVRPRMVARSLCADLETILMMGLREDPERRYQSVEQLAADVQRYLDGRPVLARGDSTGYRAAKFLRRNWAGVSAAVGVFVALSGGILTSTREARRANRAESAALQESTRAKEERDRALHAERVAQSERSRAQAAETMATTARARADREASSSRAVVDFLTNDLLGQADPNNQPDPDLTVRKALDKAAAGIESKFRSTPFIEAQVRSALASAYFELSRYAEAREQYQKAFDLRSKHLGGPDETAIHDLVSVGASLRREDRVAEAERVYQKALSLEIALAGESSTLSLLIMGNLAVVYRAQENYRKAEAFNLRVLAAQRRTLGPEHQDTLRTMNNLGVVYTQQGKVAEAEALYREILATRRKVNGPEHPLTLATMTNLAPTIDRRNPQEAVALYREALRLQTRLLGPEHNNTTLTMSNLGGLYMLMGNYAEAEQLLLRSAELRSRNVGRLHIDTLSSATVFGEAQLRQGKYAAAEATLRRTVEAFEEAKITRVGKFIAQALWGAALLGQGRLREAETALAAGCGEIRTQAARLTERDRSRLTQCAGWADELRRKQAESAVSFSTLP